MNAGWTPMQWPGAWKDPAALDLLKGSAVNVLLVEPGEEFAPVRARARELGLKVAARDTLPPGVAMVKGVWPGVRIERRGRDADAGPTGDPWVDSNGSAIRLARALHPEMAVWIEAAPPEDRPMTPDYFLMAVADAGAHGGRWMVSLGARVAAAIDAREPAAMAIWKNTLAAVDFFAAHSEWAGYTPEAVVGVVSSFAGKDRFFGGELLNLLDRAGLQYRVVLKDGVSAASFAGLRAAIYADSDAPAPEVRKAILDFVRAGGLLITGPKWGDLAAAAPPITYPHYATVALGAGKIAAPATDLNDPYQVAHDAGVLVSHRYDLVRFWNAGAAAAFPTLSPDRKRAIVHLLFYAGQGPDSATVRVAGQFRSVKSLTVDRPDPSNVKMKWDAGGVEVDLPAVPRYVALELYVK